MTVYRGKDAKVYKDGIVIGLISEVKVEISRDLVTYFSINSREAQEIVEGKESITGSLKRFYANKDLMELVCDSGTLDLFDLTLRVSSDNVNFLNLYLYDCKFTKGSVKASTGEVLTEDLGFIGKTYSALIGECPIGEQTVNGGFETGDFTGWDVVLVPLIKTTYGGITPYHGTYMAYLDTGVSISQDFNAEIPSECFDESSIFEFYWSGFWGTCEGGTEIKVRLTYTDDTYTDLADNNESTSWKCFDLKTSVESGKTLKTITISYDLSDYVLVDYVRCIP